MTRNLQPLSSVAYVAGPDRQRLRAELTSVFKFCREELGHTFIDGSEIQDILEHMMSRNTEDHVHLHEEHPDRPGDQLRVYYDRLDSAEFDRDTAARLGTRQGLASCLNHVTTLDSDDRDLIVARADRLLDSSGTVSVFEDLSGDYSVDIHVTDQGITLHSGTEVSGTTKRALTLLCDAAGATTGDVSETLKHPGGRPPKGFTSEGGELVPTERYDEICGILQAVTDGHTPKRQAASKIECSRATVDAMLDKPQLYALE